MGVAAPWTLAEDIQGVQAAAADMPYIHMLLRTSPTGDPVTTTDPDFPGLYDVQAFLDTGTSGVLLSYETASALNLQPQMLNGSPVEFNDVAIGGTVAYHVTDTAYYISLAPRNINNDLTLGGDPPPVSDFKTTTTTPIRIQMNTTPIDPTDIFASPIDIVGMPALEGKVVVMNPQLSFDDFGLPTKVIDSWVYERNEGFHPDTLATDPGIVPVHHHVKLSFADFSGYTSTTPGGLAPTLSRNPMIGPDPVKHDPNDTTAPITLTYNGQNTSGSFLLDTGAQVSFISKNMAAQMHVRYRLGTEDSDNPVLETFDPSHPDNTGTAIADTFIVPVGGVGEAQINAAGFKLTSLSLPTVEGEPIRFLDAPVVILDISLTDATGDTLTLDGDLGINFWGPSFDPSGFEIANSPFDWVVLDEQAGTLGFQFAGEHMPEPTAAGVLLIAAGAGLLRRRVRR